MEIELNIVFSSSLVKVKYNFYDFDLDMMTFRGPRSHLYCYERMAHNDQRTLDSFCKDVIQEYPKKNFLTNLQDFTCDEEDIFHFIIPPATEPNDGGMSMEEFLELYKSTNPNYSYPEVLVNVFRRNHFVK